MDFWVFSGVTFREFSNLLQCILYLAVISQFLIQSAFTFGYYVPFI